MSEQERSRVARPLEFQIDVDGRLMLTNDAKADAAERALRWAPLLEDL